MKAWFSALSIRLARPLMALTLAGCSAEGLSLPDDGSLAVLRAVSGDAQSGTAGTLLDDPLVVKATDAVGRPVQGAPILFRFTDAVGGELAPATVQTDTAGRAQAEVRLGSSAGTQTVEALADLSSEHLRVSFSLTAVARNNDGDDKKGGGKGKGGGNGNGGDDEGADD